MVELFMVALTGWRRCSLAPGLSGHSVASIPEKPPLPPSARPAPSSCARQSAAGKSLEPPLPARGEPASNAVLRAPWAKLSRRLASMPEIEVHGAALRHRQAVAQPVVAPVPGGPDAEARRPDQTAPDRHPVGCQTSVRPPSPPSSPGPRAPGRRADSLDNPQTFYRFLITPMEPSVRSPPPPTVPTDLTSRSRRFRDFSEGASRTVSNKTRSGIDNSFTLAAR